MKPEELAARSKAQATENERRVLALLADVGDVGLPPGALGERSRLPERTLRDVVARLVAHGLAGREGKKRIFATVAGRAASGAVLAGLDLLPALRDAVGRLPTETHRAFVRLLLSAIVARHHLADSDPTGWPGFIALGPTKTGKTSAALFACRVFGFDTTASVRLVQVETAGSLFARRIQETGQRWTVRRPALLDSPFVCLDELDKAAGEQRAAALRLLQGDAVADVEGERIAVRPTVLVCLNTGPEGLAALPDAYVRRCVVIDTGPLTAQLEDVDEAMRQLFAAGRIPRLDLERVRPRLAALPEAERRLLRDELKAGSTPEGWRRCDPESVARLALGRAALLGGADVRRAVYATVFDYLCCATTLGFTADGWARDLRPHLGGALVPDADQAESEATTRARKHLETAAQGNADRLAFVEERERLATRVRKARDAAKGLCDDEGQGLRAALTEAVAAIRQARTAEALAAAWSPARERVERAEALLRARRAASALTKAAERGRREAARRAKESRRSARAQWEQQRKELATLTPAADVDTLIDGLRRAGVARWEEYVYQPQPAYVETPWGECLPREKTGLEKAGDFLRGLLAPRGFWIESATGREFGPSQALEVWQRAYVAADAQVVALGGKPRPKVASFRPAPKPKRPTDKSTRNRTGMGAVAPRAASGPVKALPAQMVAHQNHSRTPAPGRRRA